MKKRCKLIKIFVCLFVFSQTAFAEDFIEKKSVYGVIKPSAITTLLAINHGIVASIRKQVGDDVDRGGEVIEILEKETNRTYRSGIRGQVVKLHVTVGAAVTPGMPMVTIMDPKQKQIEIYLSSQDALQLKPNAKVFKRGSEEVFGKISRMSQLVDPETGGVLGFVEPSAPLSQLIGDVLPLDIASRTIKDCKIVSLAELDQYLEQYHVEAITGQKACLEQKTPK